MEFEDRVSVTEPLRVGQSARTERTVRKNILMNNGDQQVASPVVDDLSLASRRQASVGQGSRSSHNDGPKITSCQLLQDAKLDESSAQCPAVRVNFSWEFTAHFWGPSMPRQSPSVEIFEPRTRLIEPSRLIANRSRSSETSWFPRACQWN